MIVPAVRGIAKRPNPEGGGTRDIGQASVAMSRGSSVNLVLLRPASVKYR